MEYDHEYAVSSVTSTLSEYPESVSAIGAKVMNALESGSHLVEKLLGLSAGLRYVKYSVRSEDSCQFIHIFLHASSER